MSARLGALLLTLAIGGAVLAGILCPVPPDAQDWARALQAPGAANWLGTDELGRDCLSRLLHGGRTTLLLAVLPALAGALAGIPLGLLSGLNLRLDPWLMRLCDVLLSLPALLVTLVIVGILGPGLVQVGCAVAAVSVPVFMRQARGLAVSLSVREFVEASRLLGVGEGRVLFRHVLPNAAPPLLALLTAQMGLGALEAAGLSFLGLGGGPGTPEWGSMLGEARAHVYDAPWLMAGPGICLAATVLGFTLLGDAAGERLDPRSRRGRR